MPKDVKDLNFAECFASFSKKTREVIIRHLANFGDPLTVAEYINAMPQCYSSNKLIIWVDENFLVWFKADSHELFVNLTKDYAFCCHIKGFGCPDEIMIIAKNKKTESFLINSESDSLRVFAEFSKYINGFESLDTIKRFGVVSEVHHCNFGTLVVTEEKLVARNLKHMSKEYYEKSLCDSNKDIIWVRQIHICENGAEDFQLIVYLLNGKILKINLGNNFDAYMLALTLKRYVPHIMYGTDAEKLRIFQRKPDELMSVAMSKVVKSRFDEMMESANE